MKIFYHLSVKLCVDDLVSGILFLRPCEAIKM